MVEATTPVPKTSKRKRKRSRYPYTAKEKTVVALACFQVSFALWALALTHLWTQVLFNLFSITILLVALSPQLYSPPEKRDPRLNFKNSLLRLMHYPVFWSGVLLIGYMLMQWANPAFGYEAGKDYWRAFPIPHIEWLPSGVDSPFLQMNAPRLAFIFAGPWMLQCALKVAIVRRNSFIRILWWTSFNFLAIGILAIAQKQSGATGVFWLHEVYPNFVGSIPYQNRAACVIMIGITLAMALYFLHLKAMRMELRLSGPHLIVLLVVVFLYGLMWSTSSRAGVLLSTLLVLVFSLMTLIPSLRDGSTFIHKSLLSFAMLLLIAVATIYTVRIPDREMTVEDFGNLREEIQNLDSNARALSTQITLEMFQQHPIYGWGAGSWRYVFAYYQDNYPEIQYVDASKTIPAIWQDAHNDWAQYLSELGLVGVVFLVGTLCWPLIESIIFIRTLHLTQVILNLGMMAVFTHALIDLLLQNQTVLCMLAVIGFLINRLNIEQLRVK